MRTIDYNIEDDDQPGMGVVDWKETPLQVLEQVDAQLKDIDLEIVMHETGGDSYIWTIEPRKESE